MAISAMLGFLSLECLFMMLALPTEKTLNENRINRSFVNDHYQNDGRQTRSSFISDSNFEDRREIPNAIICGPAGLVSPDIGKSTLQVDRHTAIDFICVIRTMLCPVTDLRWVDTALQRTTQSGSFHWTSCIQRPWHWGRGMQHTYN